MVKTILGIDEAGKGPVIGDLVIVGALFKETDAKKLEEIGVKDSKKLTPKKREELFEVIKELAIKHKIITVSPREIDQRFSVNTNLNQLEAIKFAELINELKPDVAVIDCPSANTKGFHNYLKQFVEHDCKIKCENYADLNHIEVGAASIIAKVTRDAGIRKIEKDIGAVIGAGYPSDPITIKFLETAIKNKEWMGRYVRNSWFTVQRIKDEKAQLKLSEF